MLVYQRVTHMQIPLKFHFPSISGGRAPTRPQSHYHFDMVDYDQFHLHPHCKYHLQFHHHHWNDHIKYQYHHDHDIHNINDHHRNVP